MYKLILASGSPRRRDILARMGLVFDIIPADIDESVHAGEDPADYVRRMAHTKAQTVAAEHSDAVVLGSDTVIVCDGQILGKPHDRADATAMILRLSGRTHEVFTGVSVVAADKERTILERTAVTFAEVSPELAALYTASGESDDKSGSYALQGIAAMLIERVSGSVSSVVGLPACQTRELLSQFGIFPAVYHGPHE